LAAQTSLKVWLYCTRCEASTGWVALTVTGPPMVPCGKLTYVSAPPATVAIWGVAPGRLTVTVALVPPGLSRWMLSLSMPGEALSYQLRKLVVAAWEALAAHTSLNDWLYWIRCEAFTAGPEFTVISTGPPIVPCGRLTYVSWPAAADHPTPA